MQTRKHSVLEVATGTGIGMVGSWLIVFTTLQLVPDIAAASTISTLLCTVWSISRGYAVRRYFNLLAHRGRA